MKICNIQDFSLHDGPGIRTTIFTAGCPLRCAWCHNPETQSLKSVLIYEKARCIGCRQCAQCKNSVHQFSPEHTIFRNKCDTCGFCVKNCNTSALSFSVRELSDNEYERLIFRQRRLSGNEGGITFSGGEPLFQGEELLRLMNKTDIHIAVETCGYADEVLFKAVIKRADYIMFDIKLADDEMHKKYTGVSNAPILRNLEHLRSSGTPFVLRTPLIKSVTDTKDNLLKLSNIIGNEPWEKLEFNPLTPAKYERIGKEYPLQHIPQHENDCV